MSLVKKIVWSALLGISCLIIFLPQLLSTSFGSWCLTSYLQHRFAGHWNIDSIKVQWKGVQEIKGCQWSQQHHSKLYFSQLTLQGFLPQIIFGSSALQPLKLHDAIIMLDQKSSFDHSSLLSRIHTIELLNCDIYQQAQYLHIDSCHLDLNVHHLDLKATCHLLDQQGFIDIVYDAQDKLLQASLDQFKLSWIPFLKPYLVILGEEASGSILQTKSTLQADIRTTTCSINALAQQKEDSLIFDPIYIDCNYSTAHLQRYIPSVSIEQLQATIDIEHLIFSFKDPSKLQLIAHAFFPRIVLQHAHSTHIVEELSFHAQHQEQLLITYTTKDQKIKGHITSDKNQHQFKLPAHFVLSFLPIKHQLPQELSCDLMLELQGSYLTGSLELLSDVIVFKSHFTGDIHKPITLHYSLDYESIAIDGSCILHLQQACCISKITGTIHSALGHFWFEGHCDPYKPLHLNDTYFHLQGS